MLSNNDKDTRFLSFRFVVFVENKASNFIYLVFFSLSSSVGMINAAEVSNYSGSGSGLPLLIQRSVARQISLINVIGTLSVFIYHTYTIQ